MFQFLKKAKAKEEATAQAKETALQTYRRLITATAAGDLSAADDKTLLAAMDELSIPSARASADLEMVKWHSSATAAAANLEPARQADAAVKTEVRPVLATFDKETDRLVRELKARRESEKGELQHRFKAAASAVREAEAAAAMLHKIELTNWEWFGRPAPEQQRAEREAAARRRYLVHDVKDKPAEWGTAGINFLTISGIVMTSDAAAVEQWDFTVAAGQDQQELDELLAAAAEVGKQHVVYLCERKAKYVPIEVLSLSELKLDIESIEATPEPFEGGGEARFIGGPPDPDQYFVLRRPGQSAGEVEALVGRWRKRFTKWKGEQEKNERTGRAAGLMAMGA